MRATAILGMLFLLAVAGAILPGSAPAPRAVECTYPIGTDDEQDVDDLLRGRLSVEGFAAVDLGKDIDWSSDPYGHPSWRASLHNLQWVKHLFLAADARQDERYVERAGHVIRDWIDKNPPADPQSDFSWQDRTTGLRADVLACATRYFPNEQWLMSGLRTHAAQLSDPTQYAGGWNHGLDQDLGLLAIACVLGDERSIGLAKRRIAAMYPRAIDEQGVSQEQAISYHKYSYDRFGAAVVAMRECGQDVPDDLERRLDLMPRFLAHATMPNGRYVQFGDMYRMSARSLPGTQAEFAATDGAAGVRPQERVVIYDAGYVFGRTGWGERRPFDQETFYAIRFGAPRAFHGHHDHTSIVYYAQGRPLLVDGGFSGYDANAFLGYLRSASGHNVVIATNARPAQWRNSETVLVDRRIEEGRQSFTFEDKPYDDVIRRRRIVFTEKPASVLVVDTMTGSRTRSYSQLWHLPDGFTVRTDGARATATDGEVTVQFVQQQPVASLRVVEGQREPWQGWLSYGRGERVAAPVVVSEQRGRTVSFQTLILVEEARAGVPAEDG